MGQPEPPTREQADELRAVALNTKKEYLAADHKGNLTINLNIAPWNILSIREV